MSNFALGFTTGNLMGSSAGGFSGIDLNKKCKVGISITYVFYASCAICSVLLIATFIVLAYLSGMSVIAARVDKGRNPQEKCDRPFDSVCSDIITYNNTDTVSYEMTLLQYPDVVVIMGEPENSPVLGEERPLYMSCIYGCVTHNVRYEEDKIRSQGIDDPNRYYYPQDKYFWEPPTADPDCTVSLTMTILGFTVFLLLLLFLICVGGVSILIISLLLPAALYERILFLNSWFSEQDD